VAVEVTTALLLAALYGITLVVSGRVTRRS
jgi:hypothetical protein